MGHFPNVAHRDRLAVTLATGDIHSETPIRDDPLLGAESVAGTVLRSKNVEESVRF